MRISYCEVVHHTCDRYINSSMSQKTLMNKGQTTFKGKRIKISATEKLTICTTAMYA